MKKLVTILLAAAMLALPLDFAQGRGGGDRGGGRRGPSDRKASARKASKKDLRKRWSSKKQRTRDKSEDKASARSLDRR